METDLHATEIKGGEISKSLLCLPLVGTTARLSLGRSLLTQRFGASDPGKLSWDHMLKQDQANTY